MAAYAYPDFRAEAGTGGAGPHDRESCQPVWLALLQGWPTRRTSYFDYPRNIVGIQRNCDHICSMNLELAARRLEALGNPTRLRIYRLLVRAGHAGLNVGRIQSRLKVPASTLSHHLKALLAAELIVQEREATTLICRANYNRRNRFSPEPWLFERTQARIGSST
jgi:ArsR family transcriptional regulator, arsenate/arsenite/antimonite-responsive transcriptional repressor